MTLERVLIVSTFPCMTYFLEQACLDPIRSAQTCLVRLLQYRCVPASAAKAAGQWALVTKVRSNVEGPLLLQPVKGTN